MPFVAKQNRYNRINLDGKSKNYTTTSAVDLLPGQIVKLDAAGFAVLAETADGMAKTKLYVVVGQTLSIGEVIPAGNSLTLDYMETGREFAVLVPAATVLRRDVGMGPDDDGLMRLVAAGGEPQRAYSVETYTVAAGKSELVRVRIA